MSGLLAGRYQVQGIGVHRRIRNILIVWEERISQRRDLRELADSPDLLMDIGISRYDALREGDKPFWQE